MFFALYRVRVTFELYDTSTMLRIWDQNNGNCWGPDSKTDSFLKSDGPLNKHKRAFFPELSQDPKNEELW